MDKDAHMFAAHMLGAGGGGGGCASIRDFATSRPRALNHFGSKRADSGGERGGRKGIQDPSSHSLGGEDKHKPRKKHGEGAEAENRVIRQVVQSRDRKSHGV